MFGLEEKNCLIIGASSGIGEKTAEILAKDGARVIVVARRREKLIEICDHIGNDVGKYYCADISRIDEIEALIDRIVTEQGKIDRFVYSAGIADDVPLRFMTYDRMIDSFNINYFGFVECIRQISKKKNYNKGLRIVAVSSVASIKGDKAHSIYAATKAAIDATTRCLAKELWIKEITLNTVQPSFVRTKMFDDYIKMVGNEEEAMNRVRQSQYAGLGEPEDVAHTIEFLLSEDSRYITGIAVPVDGGASTT